MAAAYGYEKQQQQPQLNAGYYGPTIPPPQPGYYGPPPTAHPRRSGASCFFGFLFKIIVIAIIALGTASLVLWLIFRPETLKAIAVTATLSRFDLVNGNNSNNGGAGDLLRYNLTVNIWLRNPNRFGIRYDYAEARASYDGDRFGFAPLRPFYLEKNSAETITATFNGESVVTDDDVRRTYRRETGEGFYYVKVRMYSDLSFRVRIVRRNAFKSKITCVLRLPVPAGGSTATITPLGTPCYVDF